MATANIKEQPVSPITTAANTVSVSDTVPAVSSSSNNQPVYANVQNQSGPGSHQETSPLVTDQPLYDEVRTFNNRQHNPSNVTMGQVTTAYVTVSQTQSSPVETTAASYDDVISSKNRPVFQKQKIVQKQEVVPDMMEFSLTPNHPATSHVTTPASHVTTPTSHVTTPASHVTSSTRQGIQGNPFMLKDSKSKPYNLAPSQMNKKDSSNKVPGVIAGSQTRQPPVVNSSVSDLKGQRSNPILESKETKPNSVIVDTRNTQPSSSSYLETNIRGNRIIQWLL